MKKERLDKILVDLGWFDNKSKASAAILAGSVKINDEVITKAGFQINPEKPMLVEIKSMPYVSRGGFKLQKAFESFDVNAKDRVCIDAGASTGGFSDFLLQNGAKFVYAVDVGYGQLAWKIRSDERVKVIERTNLKNCAFEDIYGDNDTIADLLVADMSFISITKVIENLKKLMAPSGHEMIFLIKPQFEAGKDLVDKGGVVKDKKVHADVINKVIDYARKLNYKVLGLTYSSIKGPSGNIEYLIHLKNSQNAVTEFSTAAEEIVNQAFLNLSP